MEASASYVLNEQNKCFSLGYLVVVVTIIKTCPVLFLIEGWGK